MSTHHSPLTIMDLPPPRRRETLPGRLDTTQQAQVQPAGVRGGTSAAPLGPGYGSNPPVCTFSYGKVEDKRLISYSAGTVRASVFC